MTSGITLSIAVISWNSRDMTLHCLKSIVDNTHDIDYEIIVVDNASEDGSADAVEKEFPRIRLLRNSRNLLFAEPNNQALAVSHGRYFLLLNADATVMGNAVAEMAAFLDEHPDAAAVTCRFLNPDGSMQYNMHRRFPSFAGLAFGWLYKKLPGLRTKWARDYLMLDNPFSAVQLIEQAAGACLMIRKSVLAGIGGLFDAERFPLLYNDVDLCYRLRKSGQKLYFIPHASITHIKEASLNKLAPVWRRREEVISNALFMKKHRRYLDYCLIKTSCLLVYSLATARALVWLLVKKADLPFFKVRLSVLMSILWDRRIDIK